MLLFLLLLFLKVWIANWVLNSVSKNFINFIICETQLPNQRFFLFYLEYLVQSVDLMVSYLLTV